jgi:hypothetical protein
MGPLSVYRVECTGGLHISNTYRNLSRAAAPRRLAGRKPSLGGLDGEFWPAGEPMPVGRTLQQLEAGRKVLSSILYRWFPEVGTSVPVLWQNATDRFELFYLPVY